MKRKMKRTSKKMKRMPSSPAEEEDSVFSVF